MNVGNEYLRVVLARFKSVKELGDKTLHQLSDDDIHWTLNNNSNSIAVIVKHVSGNMISRWTDFLTSDGEKPNRHRDQEFIDTIASKEEALAIWDKGWNVLLNTISQLNEEDLLKEVYIRGEGHTVIDAIERQMIHYASHVGQMIYIGKQIKDNDWETLSIPKGQSEVFLQDMLTKHKRN